MCTLDKILELLKQKNLKQKDLTDYLGLGKQTSTEWKSGRNKSYMKYVPQISKFLGVTPNYLLGTEKSLNQQLEGVEFALWGEVKDMTDDEKQDVLDYIKFKKMKRGD